MPRMNATIKGGDQERRGSERRGAAAPVTREREGRSALYKEDVVSINRCAKVTAGGKRFSFSAFVVLGDGNGKVGFGSGKAKEVSSSIDKAVRNGERNVRSYPVINGTIPHEVEGRFGAARVRLIPAAPGTGVIAGRSVRAVLEKLGIHDILTKAYGSRNPMNLVRATFAALDQLRTKEQYQALRGVEL
ncbi:MAG: 30S ribosomal protein S5 [Planctomycetota bacterium]|nr:30S ribosomal protein S5 [Planctomycetota bacterium]MCX8040822.1 30S ribosomal protein S5 [Planctomycetota bacterium]MDW8372273.1 30S ribosomal protein S5 [Planctomycetota bacterium]